MARIYLVTSGGDRIVTSGGDPLYLRDLPVRYLDALHPFKARGARYFLFQTNLFAKIVRFLDLHQDFEALTKSGYSLHAKDVVTGTVTDLGFVPADGALELTGVALADGDYEIEVRLHGYFWNDMRTQKRFPVRVFGGELITPLPTPRNLRYAFPTADTRVAWVWQSEAGTVAPDDFGIWTSITEPVDTSGPPDYVVAASSPGEYTETIAQTTALFVAIAARKAAEIGPVATLAIPEPPELLDAPAGQFARFP